MLQWLGAFETVDDRSLGKGKIYSQNAEDGILQHILSAIGTEAGDGVRGGSYVEMGTQDGSECNTRYLRQNFSWTGLMLDGGYSDPSINFQREFITVHNVVGLLEKYGLHATMRPPPPSSSSTPPTSPSPSPLDLLSVDLDCFDFWVTRAILAAGYRPRILVNEINPSVQLAPPGRPGLSVPHPDDERTRHYWSHGMNNTTGTYTGTCWGASGGVSSFYGATVSAFWQLYRARDEAGPRRAAYERIAPRLNAIFPRDFVFVQRRKGGPEETKKPLFGDLVAAATHYADREGSRHGPSTPREPQTPYFRPGTTLAASQSPSRLQHVQRSTSFSPIDPYRSLDVEG